MTNEKGQMRNAKLSDRTNGQMTSGHCEACGAIAVEGREGCQRLFDEILAREFSDYRYGRVHRLTVDTYSLQHPEQYMRSGKSFVAHLTGICAALETDETVAINQAVQKCLNGPQTVERPEEPPPGKRGALTIDYVHGATDAEEHIKRVREWARSTWSAWSAYHEMARQWIDLATKESLNR
jgi:uncharacterized OB-fold protein